MLSALHTIQGTTNQNTIQLCHWLHA